MAPKTVELWSAAEKKVVTWTVKKAKERDEGGNLSEFLSLSRNDEDGNAVEELRFSPNTTDDELAQYVKEVNRRQNHDRNAPEVS